MAALHAQDIAYDSSDVDSGGQESQTDNTGNPSGAPCSSAQGLSHLPLQRSVPWSRRFTSLHSGGRPGTRSHLSIIPVYLKFFQCFEGFCPESIVFYIAHFVNSSFLWEKNKYNDQDLVNHEGMIPNIFSFQLQRSWFREPRTMSVACAQAPGGDLHRRTFSAFSLPSEGALASFPLRVMLLATWMLSLRLDTYFIRHFPPQKGKPLPLSYPGLFTNCVELALLLGRGADCGFMGQV